jgi:hypothetical protein
VHSSQSSSRNAGQAHPDRRFAFNRLDDAAPYLIETAAVERIVFVVSEARPQAVPVSESIPTNDPPNVTNYRQSPDIACWLNERFFHQPLSSPSTPSNSACLAL